MPDQTYQLPLPLPASTYDYVELTSERANWEPAGSPNPWAVVWLHIEKVKAFTIAGGQAWPDPVSDWEEGKLAFFHRAWDPNSENRFGSLAHMPRISCHLQTQPSTRWHRLLTALGVARQRPAQQGFTITFGNGRHRTEYFRGQGVQEMPFETRANLVPTLLEYCGNT